MYTILEPLSLPSPLISHCAYLWSPPPSGPQCRAATVCVHSFAVARDFMQGDHTTRSLLCLVLSHSIKCLRVNHIIACIRIFFYIAEFCSTAWIYSILFFHSLTDGQWLVSRVGILLWTVTYASLCWHMFSFLWRTRRCGIAGLYGRCVVSFLRNHQTFFPKQLWPVCIPTSIVRLLGYSHFWGDMYGDSSFTSYWQCKLSVIWIVDIFFQSLAYILIFLIVSFKEQKLFFFLILKKSNLSTVLFYGSCFWRQIREIFV